MRPFSLHRRREQAESNKGNRATRLLAHDQGQPEPKASARTSFARISTMENKHARCASRHCPGPQVRAQQAPFAWRSRSSRGTSGKIAPTGSNREGQSRSGRHLMRGGMRLDGLAPACTVRSRAEGAPLRSTRATRANVRLLAPTATPPVLCRRRAFPPASFERSLRRHTSEPRDELAV